MSKHAVYVTSKLPTGEAVTFRVGQPVSWDAATRRWARLDNRRGGWEGVPARPVTVKHDGREYPASFVEVREVTRHGRGKGQDRHREAFTVPYRNVKSAK